MKNTISIIIVALLAVSALILGLIGGFSLTELQMQTLTVVSVIAACAVLYCFVVGEISRNNSQMDKLWSIMPIIYMWVIAIKGGLHMRLVVMAILTTLWGARLTYNFARKGAYSIKFWSGEEDYRWVILRKNKYLSKHWAWALFDLLFISFYQNFIVLATTFPAIAVMSSTSPFGVWDIIATLFTAGFLVLETVADEQQWKFQQEKKRLLKEGRTLEELPFPYNRGFNTTGVWSCSRHPNYLGEQSIWIGIYLFCIGANIQGLWIFNWSIIGSALLVLLFLGSSAFGESVSSGKYPEYSLYQKKVSKFLIIPWKRY